MRKFLHAFVFLSLVLFIQCGSDSATKEVEKAVSKTVKKTQRKVERTIKKETNLKKKSTASKSSKVKGANAKIDHNNIDLPLLEKLLHLEINDARKNNGLKKLSKNRVLTKAADNQTSFQLTQEFLNHEQPMTVMKTPLDRVEHFGGGFNMVGENLIFEGFTVRTTNGKVTEIVTPTYLELAKTMVKNWMNSPPHRKNILDKRFTHVGTNLKYNEKNHAVYATQVFGVK